MKNNEKKTETIGVRTTKEIRGLLEEIAASRGWSVSQAAHHTLCQSLAGPAGKGGAAA